MDNLIPNSFFNHAVLIPATILVTLYYMYSLNIRQLVFHALVFEFNIDLQRI